jgi:aminomethyltransferase
MTPKRTPLYDAHKAAGAKLVDFAGWEMPIQYRSIIEETEHVRKKCGVFDVSHMGEIEIKGAGALAFVSWVTTNDPALLDEGGVQYAALLNERGGVIDDLLVYRIGVNRFMLCVNASNTKKDSDWLAAQAAGRDDVEIEDRSREFGMISLQGPTALQALRPFTRVNLEEMGYYTFVHAMFEETNVLISRTGYTGEDGFELFVPWRDTASVWERIMAKGKNAQVKPIGLGARDILRLEVRYPLHGHEITDETTPLEAGLSWIVKMDKPGGFIGKEALARQKAEGVKRRLVGLTTVDRAIPRQGYPVKADGRVVGEITSGAHSPIVGAGIAMAYVESAYAEPGTRLAMEVRGKDMAVEVAPRGPFVESRVKKPTAVAPTPAPAFEETTDGEESL